jgi:acyl dehydratase
MSTTITGLDQLKEAEGKELGTSDWHEVTQKDIDTFADVTGDHQWIHIDVERAKETPFGGTIAHGYYTLSLAPMFSEQIMKFERSASTTASTRCASRPRCRSAGRSGCTRRSRASSRSRAARS